MDIKIPKNIEDMMPQDKVSELLEFICSDEFTSKVAKDIDTYIILEAISEYIDRHPKIE